MQKTKIIIATVALAAIALTIVGLASAQILANQTYTNSGTTPNTGFWGWIGNCFGFNSYQPYYGNSYLAPTQPAPNTTSPYPYAGGNYYGYGYGYGPCWARW